MLSEKELGKEPSAGKVNNIVVKEIGNECCLTGRDILVDEDKPPKNQVKDENT